MTITLRRRYTKKHVAFNSIYMCTISVIYEFTEFNSYSFELRNMFPSVWSP